MQALRSNLYPKWVQKVQRVQGDLYLNSTVYDAPARGANARISAFRDCDGEGEVQKVQNNAYTRTHTHKESLQKTCHMCHNMEQMLIYQRFRCDT